MTPTIKGGFGVIAILAVCLLVAAGVRGAENQQPAPAAAAVVQPGQQPAPDDPCQGMMGRMGMPPMGRPGPMPGMGGMMGMPGMQMGEMGMMPMMHEHMMMRMMARNPKLAGKMMQMRADMMRAMADVLTKYGKEMESGQWPAAKDKGGDGD